MIRIETRKNEAGSLDFVITDETEHRPLVAHARVSPTLKGTALRDALAYELRGALGLLTAVREGRPHLAARCQYRGRIHRILGVRNPYAAGEGDLYVVLDDGVGVVPWADCSYEGI